MELGRRWRYRMGSSIEFKYILKKEIKNASIELADSFNPNMSFG